MTAGGHTEQVIWSTFITAFVDGLFFLKYMIVPFPMNMALPVCYFPGRDLSYHLTKYFCYPRVNLWVIAFQSF